MDDETSKLQQGTYQTYGVSSGSNVAKHAKRRDDRFLVVAGVSQLMILFILIFGAEYGHQAMSNIQYIFYKDVALMMLVGFGFLMTFLGKYGLSSIGFTFFLTCLIVQWGAICSAFFSMAYTNMAPPAAGSTYEQLWQPYANGFDKKIQMDVNSLLNGNFAAATILISFGALIGKVGPARMALLAMLEVVCYCFNRYLVTTGAIGTTDMGGTIFIHLFGAYYGLAASRVLMKYGDHALQNNLNKGADASTYVSDLFSFVGTIFLWLYWPSFNGATAPGSNGGPAIGAGKLTTQGDQQLWITINTVIGLAACCVSSFFFSRIIGGKGKEFRPVDIQNATLAGGVAMGAASNLQLTPGGACGVGISAALISTFGFGRLQEILQKKIGLHDSCGIHNLHGMPAIFGTFVVIIATINASREEYGAQYDIMFPCGSSQPLAQLFGGLATFGIAIVTGTISAIIVDKVMPIPSEDMFMDHVYWETGNDYKIE